MARCSELNSAVDNKSQPAWESASIITSPDDTLQGEQKVTSKCVPEVFRWGNKWNQKKKPQHIVSVSSSEFQSDTDNNKNNPAGHILRGSAQALKGHLGRLGMTSLPLRGDPCGVLHKREFCRSLFYTLVIFYPNLNELSLMWNVTHTALIKAVFIDLSTKSFWGCCRKKNNRTLMFSEDFEIIM